LRREHREDLPLIKNQSSGFRLYFSVLDNKKDCFGFYQNGELFYETPPDDMRVTWKHSETLCAGVYEYCSVLARTDTFDSACPLELSTEWQKVDSKLRAFHKSFGTSNIDLNEHCFFDMVPQQFLLDYFSIKEAIMKHIYETTEKTENFNFDCRLHEMLREISKKKVKINHEFLTTNQHRLKVRNLSKKLKKITPFVKYKQFSTTTGRLTVEPSSFPIMTLDKEVRDVVLPDNDFIIELDYNAAELRVFLGLSGHQQPDGDLHEWNSTFLKTDRQQAKRSVIAYMYGGKSLGSGELEALYNVSVVKQKHFNQETEEVKNPFGRKIKSDDFHAVNYTIQSTTAEIVFRNMLKIHELLKNHKSSVKFCLHDSIVLDFSNEDRSLLEDIRTIFSSTPFGDFPARVSGGKSFGKMKEMRFG
jgi:hypothetical protein